MQPVYRYTAAVRYYQPAPPRQPIVVAQRVIGTTFSPHYVAPIRPANPLANAVTTLETCPEYSPLWQWVGRRKEKEGYIDILVMKELDASSVEEVLENAFPNTELTPANVQNYLKGLNDEGERKGHGRYLENLGYKISTVNNRVYLELPDAKVLSARWIGCFPNMRPLKIFEASGELDDVTFLEAFFQYDFVLSPSVHDHFIHAIRTIQYRLNPPENGLDFETNRKAEVEVVKKIYGRLVNARQLIKAAVQNGMEYLLFTHYACRKITFEEFPKYLTKLIGALSYIADNLTAEDTGSYKTPFSELYLNNNIAELETSLYFLSKTNPQYTFNGTAKYKAQKYFEKRFPPEEYRHTCQELLTAIETLEKGEGSVPFPEFSPLWKFEGRRGEKGGEINILQLKPEFDSLTPKDPLKRSAALTATKKALESAYPNTESSPADLRDLLKKWNDEGEANGVGRYLDQLGYKFYVTNEKVYLEIPSAKALSSRWMTHFPNLRPLKIFEANVEPGDKAFLQVFFRYDFVLSQSLHDHFVHAIYAIRFLLHPPKTGLDFDANRKSDVAVLKKMYDRIVNAQELLEEAITNGKVKIHVQYGMYLLSEFPKYLTKLMGALSFLADALSAEYQGQEKRFTDLMLNRYFRDLESSLNLGKEDSTDKKYFIKRFPPEEYPLKCEEIVSAIESLEKGEGLS